ncbi:hypothetical protein R5R35_007046 [Gryllus longicercus]|uniref:Cytochrome P450 n=1 Tax=Gryllus longicercus TaxID=2509291 RepID=A0AAN9VF01_9ORTH
MALLFESWSTDLLVALVTLCIFIYWFFNNNWDYWEKRNVPFCKPSPFVGNFKDRVLFRKGLAELAVDQYNELKGHKFGGIWLFQSPCLLIRDPEVIKRVLVKNFSNFHDRGVDIDEKINPLAEHLFTLSGSKWRALRVKLTPTFTSGKMKMMFSLMNECATELVQFLTSEAAKCAGELEMKEISAKFTTDVIGSCAFGLQFNSMKDPNSEFRAMGRKITSPNPSFALRFTFLQFAPKLVKRLKLRIFPSDVSAFFLNAVKETIEYRETNNVKRNDFLQLLIDLKNKGKVDEDQHEDTKITVAGIAKENDDTEILKFTDNLVAAQAFVFFVAGFEATSSTISFALHELSVNREIQQKARKEVDDILQESSGEITYEALKKMDYIDNIISETLRKYPPAAVLLRTCTEPYADRETGLVVEEGVRVQIPVYALHHDPEYYPDPQRFDPERFSDEQRAKRPNYVYLPFGEGPKMCIGMRFALLQAKLGLVTVLSRFDVVRNPRTPHPIRLDPKTNFTASKDGVWVRLVPRDIDVTKM